MSPKLNRLPALLALLALLVALPASAQPAEEIAQMLRQRDRQIKAIVGTGGTPAEAQRERLRAVVNEAIDFEGMAELALGDYWGRLSAEQRRAFTEAFAGVVRAQSLADLEPYRGEVSYGAIEVSGERALAHTTTRYRGTSAPVDYVLRRKGGTWRITNVVIDGTGTAEGYAASFQRVLRRDGLEAGYERLMQSLRRRLERGG